MAKVSIVIPNWNGIKLLKVCLPSLINQTFKDIEIIVVDNGSTDKSCQFIDKKFPQIKVIKLPYNLGFASAVNLGIINSSGKFICLVNNDTEVDKDCLNFLVESLSKHPRVGMVGAKMLNYYKRDRLDGAGDYIDAVGHANNIDFGQKDNEEFNRAGYIFLVSGGGSLFRRKVFDKVGFFDEDYFAYFEDVDLCFRAQIKGFKAYFEPRAKIYHIHKATSRRVIALTEYLQFRNMTQTIIKCFPKELLLKDFNWLRIILVNLNTIRFLASQGFLKQALQAELYILVNIIRLLQKRKKIQSNILVSKDYIIKNVKPKKITIFGLTRGV